MFEEINNSLKRFQEIATGGIQENGLQAMTREENIALDKIHLSFVHNGGKTYHPVC